jgi:heme-degrading monooxygenase HmoA
MNTIGDEIAETPDPPYYAVLFSSLTTDASEGYAETAARMVELAAQQPGFLGVESARETLGITVSYWTDLDSIKAWKRNAEHLMAQKMGREKFYSNYKTRIARVERDYSM